MTRKPAAESFLLAASAASDDPRIMGWIGVVESDNVSPRAFAPALNRSTKEFKCSRRQCSCLMTASAMRDAAATATRVPKPRQRQPIVAPAVLAVEPIGKIRQVVVACAYSLPAAS